MENSISFYEEKYLKENQLEKLEFLKKCRDYIGKEVSVIIDRPLGSKPIPEYPDFVYELNYGYVPNTISGDGEELDCYILGVYKPIQEFTGECIAIVHRLNELDDKLVIVSKGEKYSIKEIENLIFFSEQHHKSVVIQ